MTTTQIFVVTPCFNAAETIDQSISSVLSQAGDFDLHYHVQDGGSKDETVDLLKRWERRLQDGSFPTFCRSVSFSYESVADRGMYDAIARAFSSFEFVDEDWLTWINADDLLAPGACALMAMIDGDPRRDRVNWICGSAAVVSSGTMVATTERLLSSDVIRKGLCDGTHWEFVQQEGTFFRGSLWRSIDPYGDFSSLRLAGDWNLWRRFAAHAELHQVNYPLGLFQQREGQLSQTQRDRYMEEIDGLVPRDTRTLGLVELIGRPLHQKRVLVDYKTRLLQFPERDLVPHLKYLLQRRFGEERVPDLMAAVRSGAPPSAVLRAMGMDLDVPADASDDRAGHKNIADPTELSSRKIDILAHDADWQFPAVTEQHAFERVKQLLPWVPGVLYLAFPWATLFDQKNSGRAPANDMNRALASLSPACVGYERVVTVCQHIHMLQFADLLTGAGVTDVFWSHASMNQTEVTSANGRTLRIHPFPLYPVQAEGIDRSAIDCERKLLFSFVGARSNQWYLTQSRDWILEKLGAHPRGFVSGRDGWHYQRVVYEHQIHQTAEAPSGLVDDEASRVFRELLLDSIFSLCPSGSGPNSIRLWESIGAGAIPVILADTYQVPGDPELWKNAVVFCNESPEDVAALPARLEAIAADPDLLESKRRHLEQLWMLYGPDTFVTDIHRFYVSFSGAQHARQTAGYPLSQLADRVNAGQLPSGGLESFLKLVAGRLLIDKSTFVAGVRQSRSLRIACEYALSHCIDAELVGDVTDLWLAAGLSSPGDEVRRRALPLPIPRQKIHLYGRHSNRTPMSYPAYRRLFERRIDYVEDAWKADTVVTGFDIDFQPGAEGLLDKIRARPELKYLVVSEEPLWDTVWSRVLTEPSGRSGDGAGALHYDVANHVNSNVFVFDKLPYFITTDDRFFQRYAVQFQRNAAMSAEEVLECWRSASIRAAFYAERRIEDRYDLFKPEIGVRGLCSWRTRVAEHVQRGPIVRVGQGWSAAGVRRQSLADWHLDKLSALDRKALFVSGLENTHQHNYITEKIFDAYAVLGIPLYYAAPSHRIHELCPDGGFLNLYGQTEGAAAAVIDAFEPDLAFARAYVATQKSLAERFSDPGVLNQERARVVDKVLDAMSGYSG